MKLENSLYKITEVKMGDKFLICLSSENRKNANVKGGAELEVNVGLD